jgi:ABC-type uncharacterized transport system permease subunit
MTRCEYWFSLAIAYACGFVSAFLFLIACVLLEPMDRKVRAKVLMLQAMNFADEDARWRLKQMAQAMKTSPVQALQEIEMYERMDVFPAERPPGANPISTIPGVPTGSPPVPDQAL